MIVRRSVLVLVLAGGLLSLAACSSTRIVSAVAPDAAARVYRRLLIVPMFGDPAKDRAAEEAYGRVFKDGPLEVLPASRVLPAGIGEEAFYDLLAKNGVDGVLVLRPGAAGAVPGDIGDYHAGRDLDYHRNSCDAKLLTWQFSKPGDELNEAELAKPWLDMTVTLIAAAARKPAWSARSRTQGTQGTAFSQLIRTQAVAAVGKMGEDGILGKP